MNWPERAVVITMASTAERLGRFLSDWEATGPGIDLDVYHATPNPIPEHGCWQSHFEVLSSAGGPLLVLEDDAFFVACPDLDIPADADLFYLGGEHVMPPTPAGEGVVIANRVRRTHAYVALDPKRIADRLGPPNGHVDYALADNRELRSYAIAPFIAGQRGGHSSINSPRPVDMLWNDDIGTWSKPRAAAQSAARPNAWGVGEMRAGAVSGGWQVGQIGFG